MIVYREHDSPKKSVQTSTKEKMLSCPGFANSLTPPGMNFDGRPLQLTTYRHAAVSNVEAAKNTKPCQFSRPRMPAAAPAKQEERNLTELRALLWITLGA